MGNAFRAAYMRHRTDPASTSVAFFEELPAAPLSAPPSRSEDAMALAEQGFYWGYV